MKTLYLYTDGGSRGNPGPSAVGVVLKTPEGKVLESLGQRIGLATNNIAEYRALLKGLEVARKYEPEELICFLDSLLVVNQLKGEFKVRQSHLRQLFLEVQEELSRAVGTQVAFRHISREKNTEADKLLNQAFSGPV